VYIYSVYIYIYYGIYIVYIYIYIHTIMCMCIHTYIHTFIIHDYLRFHIHSNSSWIPGSLCKLLDILWSNSKHFDALMWQFALKVQQNLTFKCSRQLSATRSSFKDGARSGPRLCRINISCAIQQPWQCLHTTLVTYKFIENWNRCLPEVQRLYSLRLAKLPIKPKGMDTRRPKCLRSCVSHLLLFPSLHRGNL